MWDYPILHISWFINFKLDNLLSIFIPSALVSVSGVTAVFASVPSFATTKVRVSWSTIEATGPLHPLKAAIQGEDFWLKSEVEIIFIRGCETVMLTIDPKLLTWWSLTWKTNGRFARIFAFSFAECHVLGLSSLFSVTWVTSDWICLVFDNNLSTNSWSVYHFNQLVSTF